MHIALYGVVSELESRLLSLTARQNPFNTNLSETPMNEAPICRRLPVGAEFQPNGGVHFRVWAPRCRRLEVMIEPSGRTREAGFELESEKDGYFSGLIPGVGAGVLYHYRLDGGAAYPDPASRFQPRGPHGPSEIIDPRAFRWTDREWRGAELHGQVIYEMHIGTFTRAGTWEAATAEIAALADTGITALEVMPVADFAGRFGWGYDGVDLYAPTRLYGNPDDFRRFVDSAHRCGLAVILDVVYNHIGPDGSYLKEFSDHYFTDRHENEWGEAINFDGERSKSVREFFIANAGYWVDEFHIDGLRLDATQQIFDASPVHVLQEITAAVRRIGGKRATLVIAENEPQHVKLIRPVEHGGYGMDALWNDDFHHTALVSVTGRSEAYYSDHWGRPQEIISAIKWGFLFQGQRYSWQKKSRGTPAFGIPHERFVHYIENHDQIANSGSGARIHQLTSPGRYRAITAVLLLAPATPMLFQGQEFAASSPFLFFADHKPELAALVRQGRREFISQFPSLAGAGIQRLLADPCDPATFDRCKLDFAERKSHGAASRLHRDLLRLRREDLVFRVPRAVVDGAVLGSEALVLRFFSDTSGDRLLVVNLGRDLRLAAVPEPLLAPPEGHFWQPLWHSEDPCYGGGGVYPLETDEGWRIPAQAAIAIAAVPQRGD